MSTPNLIIDLDRIEHNARAIVSLCREHNMTVTGVTKVCCGDPLVARAMLAGGVDSIGDSRLENLRRLRAAGVTCPLMLLRLPTPSRLEETVALADLSLNSEPAVLAGLSAAAGRSGVTHGVILMVELGDLREGFLPRDLLKVARETVRLPHLQLLGIGTNLACFAGVAPSDENMAELAGLAQQVEKELGVKLELISAANSSGLNFIAAGQMPAGLNHARIGEAILLGCETLHRTPWPGTDQQAFTLRAEILELQEKPSRPAGARGEDAFGGHPEFAERGVRRRALLNVGRGDIEVRGLMPLEQRFTVLGASSGYLVADVSDGGAELKVGDELGFRVNYAALLAAMISPYVEKIHLANGRRVSP